MKKNNWNSFALFIALFIAQQGLAAEVPATQIVITPAQQQTLGIKVAEIAKDGNLASQRLAAEVMIPVSQERVITAPQSGLVAALHVAAGQQVKKGQALAQISSPDMVGLQSEYLQAWTQHQLAADMLARDKELYQEGIIAQRRFLTTQSRHAETSAVLSQRKQALLLAGMSNAGISQLQKSGTMSSSLTLTTPIDGQVLEQMAKVGQRVEMAAPLYRVATLSPLWLEIRAPLDLLDAVRPGLLVRVPNSGVEGKLISVIRNVNKNDQTIQLRAEVSQGAEKLYPGQYAEVEIVGAHDIESAQQQFVLPKFAVVRSGTHYYIFVQNAQGFIATMVEVVSEKSGMVSIRAELSGKEKVAVAGTAAIKGKWLGVGDE
ncbi:MAG: efflux RND transporter periplasmic adaptor subunit [Betaproteobacteria bacterium HGW-Betaproteobacteria-8]|nr:MAG: efflux RND transporter periplasmic adaptor subunit [Betaproteobacteria bacterium HGW-Betaproteobacteria-8]